MSTQILRQAVLKHEDDFSTRFPKAAKSLCGYVALALNQLGYGKIARIYVKTDVDFKNMCVPAMEGDGWELPHYVVIEPTGNILDVSLPEGFVATGYGEPFPPGNQVHEDDRFLYRDADAIRFWRINFSRLT